MAKKVTSSSDTPQEATQAKEKKPRRAAAKKAAPTDANAAALSVTQKAVPQPPAAQQKSTPFFAEDTREMDRALSPQQGRELEGIYASLRSGSPLSGEIVGLDSHTLDVLDPVTSRWFTKEILCLVVMSYRIKIIIPDTEIWHHGEDPYPNYVVKNMVGAKTDYVITHLDRENECALASRSKALKSLRYRFMSPRRHIGEIVKANVVCVGPSRMIVECGGFDLSLHVKDVSYTAIADLRTEYNPGQTLHAKIMELDVPTGRLGISIKEVNPNPYDGAEIRHPTGSTRRATITGTYKGGVFCRLSDDTTILCSYSPSRHNGEFYIGDSVVIRVQAYNNEQKQIYGKLVRKW